MNVIEKLMTKNYCYTNPTKIEPKGLMLHSIGTPQPKAMVLINQWNSSKRDDKGELIIQTSIHGFVDALTGDYYHTMPYDYKCWHGYKGPNGSANNDYIGIEMCEPDCIKYKSGSASFTVKPEDKAKAQEMVRRTYASAVEVFAMLCKQFSFDPLSPNVIISHREGHINGIASNHGDPEHLWTGLDLPFTMNTFRRDVASAMQVGGFIMPPADAPYQLTPSEEPRKWAVEPYKVRITTPALRIREQPSTVAKILGFTGRGVFTIVGEVKDVKGRKWGLLKSYEKKGNGWIALDSNLAQRLD